MDNITKKKIAEQIHRLYENQGSENHAHLTQEVINIIDRESGYALNPVERDVTILLSDLRGFTALSENYSPLEIIDLLNRYFSAMSKVISRYGGTIDKFMGDAIMVVFGSPTRQEDDLERTLACAIAMQIRLNKLNIESKASGYPELYMGIGINTGKVVAGKLGSEIYSEYTVIGDHVNLASRVESHSLRGQILISENTYRQAKDYIEVGQENSLSVKGKKEAVKLYELLSTQRPETLSVPRKEIRKSPRVEVNMPLSFYKIDGKIVGAQPYFGEIIDLSYGGMYISSQHELPLLTEIKFPLSLSISANVSSDVYAKIIRINSMDKAFHYNLEFSGISPQASEAIKRFIDRIIEGYSSL